MRVLYITVLVFSKPCLINTLSFYTLYFFVYNSVVSFNNPNITRIKDFWYVLKDCVDFVKSKTIPEFLNHWLFTAKFVQEP